MTDTIIKRDGEIVATVPTADVLAWFHKSHGHSMHHALTHEGYSIEEVTLADAKLSESDEPAEVLDDETPKNWPTAEQFDAAHELGTNYALAQRRNGADEPREAPLSGEWADDITPADITTAVGFLATEDDDEDKWIDARDELADAWERGYFDAWAHEDSVQAIED